MVLCKRSYLLDRWLRASLTMRVCPDPDGAPCGHSRSSTVDADAGSTAAVLETITISDDGAGDLAPDATAATASAIAADISNDEATPGPRVDESSEPPAKGQRAPLQDRLNDQEPQQATRPSVVPACAAAVPIGSVEGPAEQLEPPTVNQLKEWATWAFADPKGDRVELPTLAAAYQSTNGLLLNAKEAVRQLFEQQRKQICRSPERSDLQLSQEEALGWLLAHARCRRLLDDEARPIGKVAAKQAGVVKKQHDAVRDSAKTKRSKARKRSATAEEVAAIDAEAEAQRAAISLHVFAISHMPAADSEIVERRHRVAAETIKEHVCSDACSDEGVCPRAHAIVEAAMSEEAADLFVGAFVLARLSVDGCREGRDPYLNEELQLAEVHFSHALRRFKAAQPEFGEYWGQRSENMVIEWAVRLAANGDPIPAAERAARAVGFPWEENVGQWKAFFNRRKK